MSTSWQLIPQGDRCLLVQFGGGIALDTGLRCTQAARLLRARAPTCVRDLVPSFTSVAIHFLPDGSSDQLERLQAYIHQTLDTLEDTAVQTGTLVDIPVCYGGDFGPDLADMARQLALTEQQLIELHSSLPQLVFMVGFAPGAPYLGMLPDALNLPRRTTPRTTLPQGSVAIANRQTIIYPNASPGGWHLIGRTPLSLFDPLRSPPARLEPGDQVRFVPISPEQFEHWTAS
ncbi:5-oxoprolinase subunit PxpB [Alcaligenes sp. SDU_A2]|uniref:5-oxoprolinase subunit PxpB n=1 Tax=Alcaligenes sp. SDU_A2 TaxID=3136634 RepID=UPI002B6B0980|nr:5-oxoprolinase subunit PxpB [Alcaligenes sp.]HRL27881.1 5-oxoprolinase subunit PxpB [Alcaligenes sp.]